MPHHQLASEGESRCVIRHFFTSSVKINKEYVMNAVLRKMLLGTSEVILDFSVFVHKDDYLYLVQGKVLQYGK